MVAFVLAGGQGQRLRPLTDEHAKPALTLVRGVKIVDFVLSNLLNSGVVDVRILVQYKPRSLISHLERTWRERFAASGGSLEIRAPDGGACTEFAGTADAVYHSLDSLNVSNSDLVAVFAADQVYRMDLRQMSEFHVRNHADLTVAATVVPVKAASAFGVLVTDSQARILRFEEKPEHPVPLPGNRSRAYASMGNYIFRSALLVEALRSCVEHGGNDFGRHLVPELVRRNRAYAYSLSINQIPGLRSWEKPGYWKDVGTRAAFTRARMDLSRQLPSIEIGNLKWPIFGAA